MKLSLDTNILVAILRGKEPELHQRFLSNPPMNYAVSEIVRAELMHGVEMSHQPVANREKVEALLEPLERVPFAGRASDVYGEIKAILQRKGMGIGSNDLLIAASAVSEGHRVITRNTKEFSRVPGLEWEEW